MGDRAAALAAYERCRQVLHGDLGVEPDEATRALYEQIRNNELKIENVELRRETDVSNSQFSIFNLQFDLVTCYYDSLNYLLGDRDLARVFAGVARALRPGGYTVFDLNTAAEYATWDERDSVTHDGRDCMVYNQLSYDPATCLATGRIVWFVREIDRWWRGEETHIERAWGDDEVRTALAGAGLALIGRYDVTGGPAADDATRVVYVARHIGANPSAR
jgi:SAM-dependent methyltransferase